MAQCYENRFFCKQCDYSTEKKINYLRHVKRNHSTSRKEENDRPSCSKVTEDTCDDNSVADSTRSKEADEDHGSSSEDEEAWLSKDPDVSIGEATETVHLEERSQEVDTGTTNDPTVRKRTSPMPVYSPAPLKVARPCTSMLDAEQRDPPASINIRASAEVRTERKMADCSTQTEPVRYTKSITTTTIVKEGGRKVITVKKEKML
ncbi:uncharacterized protein LOC133178066 [Saccostrea echinata]|uniref:uncharacterized protein LOC133178066 n=1 Tax=Saccostrea echinata TaxID=191078 RepID=UPI002A8056DE|nr:uncharacterized protein LOC133178066 [Saccostrea echinata]